MNLILTFNLIFIFFIIFIFLFFLQKQKLSDSTNYLELNATEIFIFFLLKVVLFPWATSRKATLQQLTSGITRLED